MNLETLASVCSGLEVDFPPREKSTTVSLEMGTVETRSSKTLPLSPESDKTKPPKENTLNPTEGGSTKNREGSEAVTDHHVRATQENGISDLGAIEVTGKEDVSGEKGMAEENGVSLAENESKPDGEAASEDDDEEVGGNGHEGLEFCVGDFVWGKIKSHPWWPGQIYDPSNASEFAAKIKHKGKHLVAYFGDGTFAWCQPSQLKPFEESFYEMSKQSSTKTFVAAVQQAVDEIGRVLELKMTCSCVPEQNRGRVVHLVAENAGVKEGSLVPEGKIRKFSDVLAESSDLLGVLKRIAQAVHRVEELELSILMSRVSAFYSAKGICELPRYHDPVLVSGLEDKEKLTAEIPAQGPFEDWLPLSIDVSKTQDNQPLLQSCPLSSENKRTPRRKQRSIADLIAEDGTSSEKKASPSGAKKRKCGEDLDGDENSSLTSFSGKAKKTRLSSGSRGNTSIGSVSSIKKDFTGEGKEETKERVASKGRKTKKKDAADSEVEDGGAKAANSDSIKSDDSPVKKLFEKSPSFRERKKSKYLSPPFTDANSSKRKKDAETEPLKVSTEDGATGLSAGTETLKSKDTAEPAPGDETSHGSSPKQKTPLQKKTDVSANELLSEVRSAAANPFTRRGKKSVEMVSDFMSVFRDSVYCNGSNNEADNDKPQPRKRKRKMSESESGSQVKEPKKPVDKSPKTNHQSSAAVDKSEGKKTVETRGRKRKQETATPEAKKKKMTTDKEIVDKPKGKQAVETSTPEAKKKKKTTDKKTVEKSKGKQAVETSTPEAKKKKKKKKKMTDKKTVEESKGKEAVETATPEAKKKKKTTNKKTVEKLKGQQEVETASPELKKTKDKETAEEGTVPATLIVEFAPGSNRPLKADLIRMYGKYGELDEVKTDMYYANQCARVYFLNGSHAESAYKDSKAASPFGSTSVEFILESPSREYKTQKLKEISGKKADKTQEKPSESQGNGGGGRESDLRFIRQKLEGISSMLEEKDGKMSPAMKSKLKGEVSGLLEKVSTMVVSSS